MTFEVDINGRSRTVSVEPAAPGRYRVTVDAQPHDVDAARVGTLGLSLFVDAAERASHDVQVAPAARTGDLLIRIDGRIVTATVNGRRAGRAALQARMRVDGEQSIVAPMPGRVVRILVSPGDAVTARQGVVVVEAMKMENELRAPKDGRVKEVAVEPGASVEAGRVLVVIE